MKEPSIVNLLNEGSYIHLFYTVQQPAFAVPADTVNDRRCLFSRFCRSGDYQIVERLLIAIERFKHLDD